MKHISMDLVRVTEAAAIAAASWVGSGNKLEADRVATEAMKSRLNKMAMRGRVAIGEGKKDNSYGLFKGDSVGAGKSESILDIDDNYGLFNGVHESKDCFDIAVDPIDGTTPTVNSGPEAMSVIAVSNSGTMFDTEEHYMLKFAVSGEVAKNIDLSSLTPHLSDYTSTLLPNLCHKIAEVLGKPTTRLMVCILNRPRHQKYIEAMRSVGVRIKLIQDCDISGAIATCLPDSEIDMQFGVGGAPEAVITAAAMKCLGGYFVGQIWREDSGVVGPVMTMDDLVQGECAFAATGITNGSLLKGVRFDSRGPITNSVFMRSESGTIRWLTTNHGN